MTLILPLFNVFGAVSIWTSLPLYYQHRNGTVEEYGPYGMQFEWYLYDSGESGHRTWVQTTPPLGEAVAVKLYLGS